MTAEASSTKVNTPQQSSKPAESEESSKEQEGDGSETPRGKISCLLCRGFISYKNSDRSRIRDHMVTEHDVKFDSDVIMAISVMSAAEKQFIVESAAKRLGEIGNNQIPTSGETLLPRPALTGPAPAPAVAAAREATGATGGGRGRGLPAGAVISPVAGRGRAPTFRGGAGGALIRSVRPAVRPAVRPVRPVSSLPAAAAAKVPLSVQNMSISISVVDQTVKCSQCDTTFKNSSLLAEHTKTIHLAKFSSLGLSITTPGIPTSPAPPAQKRAHQPSESVMTPPAKQLMLQPRAATPRRGRGRAGGVQYRLPGPQKPAAIQVKTEPKPVPVAGGGGGEGGQGKVDPVIKCNDCAQFIKQSVFKQHKLDHLAAKKDAATPSSPKVDSPKPQPPTPQTSKEKPQRPKPKRREEKQIDFVDLGDVSDEEEVTDVTQKKVLEKTIPCPSCDVKFATNMSLKMHLNLQHPVKAEATDTEHLLTEEKDDSEERDEKIRDEMNSMGTSEMLDDLVSFLNEL